MVIGAPAISRAQTGAIKIGVPTILSGRVAILGQTSVGGLKVVFDKFNEAGGINGRKIEMVVRDSKGAPQEAAKVTRDLINNDKCEIILDAEASSGAFAVQEVIRESGRALPPFQFRDLVPDRRSQAARADRLPDGPTGYP